MVPCASQPGLASATHTDPECNCPDHTGFSVRYQFSFKTLAILNTNVYIHKLVLCSAFIRGIPYCSRKRVVPCSMHKHIMGWQRDTISLSYNVLRGPSPPPEQSMALWVCGAYFYVKSTQARLILEKEITVETMSALDWPVGKMMAHCVA